MKNLARKTELILSGFYLIAIIYKTQNICLGNVYLIIYIKKRLENVFYK